MRPRGPVKYTFLFRFEQTKILVALELRSHYHLLVTESKTELPMTSCKNLALMVKSSLFIFSAGKTPSELESTGLQLTLSTTKANIHSQGRNRDADIENKCVADKRGEGYTGRPALTCIHTIDWPFATPWTLAPQAPLSMGFSRQEHWSGVPEDLPNPGVEPRSPALQVDSLPIEPLGNPKNTGMGSALLQWIFRTQESNQGLSRILE